MKKVLITGGTGLVGKRLSKLLQNSGYQVDLLSRKRSKNEQHKTWLWDLEKNWIEEGALEDAHAIIHLAGANIGSTPFNDKGKKLLIDSRIKTSKLLFESAKTIDQFPEVFISASAIGYYGMNTSSHIYSEEDLPGDDFVGELSLAWEKAADSFLDHSRVAKIRIGLVLDKDEGALAKLALPIKFGMGSALGTGNQWMPWIHLDDLCSIFKHALVQTNYRGAYNGVAPEHVTHRSFIESVARQLKRPYWLPNTPTWLLKIFLGEKTNLLVEGSRVSSKKLVESGFEFKYENLKAALEEIYS